MKVLLTGATGFFGQAVLRALPESGQKTRCVIRTGTADRLVSHAQSIEIIETQDVFSLDSGWWTETCQDIDVVIHCAWYAEPGKYLTSRRNLSCLSGTLALAEGALAANVPRFVGIGTCFEYDVSHGHLSIETPLAPQTLYAATKTSAFLTLTNLFQGVDATTFLWARLFYLFGSGEHENRLFPYLHARLKAGRVAELSSGRQIRDYIDVDEAARMLLDDISTGVEGPSNICSGRARTITEWANEIADEYGRRDLLNFGARPDNLVDPPTVVGVRPDQV